MMRHAPQCSRGRAEDRRRTCAAFVALLVLAACGGKSDDAAPSLAPIRYGPDGSPSVAVSPPSPRPWVLLICIDTVRADAAAATASMPETIAWLAPRAVHFRGASTAAPWTGPAVASLLTGLLPSRHGGRELGTSFRVVPAVTTVMEILGVQGWTGAAFTGGGWVSMSTGMLQGFPESTDPFSFGAMSVPLVASQREIRATAPRFLFLHTYEAHDAYLAPPAHPGPPPSPPADVDLAAIDLEASRDGGRSLAKMFLLDWTMRRPVFETAPGRRRMQAVTRYFEKGFREDPKGPELAETARKAYLEGTSRLDRALAGYLQSSEAAGLLKDTIVVLTSDHGEAFGEHGTLHHGRHLYDELLRVPLYVSAPGWPRGKVVDGSCSLLDVTPTLLDLLGLPPSEGLDGRSLAPLVKTGEGWPVVSEERRTAAETGLDDDAMLTAVRDVHWKWIQTRDAQRGTVEEEIYDLSTDPGEKNRLSTKRDPPWSKEFAETVQRLRNRR